jgi:nickel transport protein
MKYSKVLLHSPQDPEVPYQSGVTDVNGGFAFIPNVPGLWKFAANDGQGHLSSGELEVVFPEVPDPAAASTNAADAAPAAANAAPEPAKAPALASGGSKSPSKETIGLGLSVIINVALLATLLWKKPKPLPKNQA